MTDLINEFIEIERKRFEIKTNNSFAMGFSQIVRYYDFLSLIMADYEKAAGEFVALMNRHRELFKESGPMNAEQLAFMETQRTLTQRLHLEIESFFLFSKILLDIIAHSIEFYFGPARNLALDSHDDLAKCLDKYVKTKGLTSPPAELIRLTDYLKKNISDYRDYEICHQKSPRVVKGTTWSLDGKRIQIQGTKIYPKDGEADGKSSEVLHDLMQAINDYLRLLIGYLSANNKKTKLTLDSKQKSVD